MSHETTDQEWTRATVLHDAQALVAHLRQHLDSDMIAAVGLNGRLLDMEQLAQTARAAAVLAPLYSLAGQPHLLFTRRSQDMRAHKGEISFPGGARDLSDTSLEHTALRETYEELGVARERIAVVGMLPPVFAAVSNYLITPYVGWLGEGLPALTPNAREVAEVIHAPLAALADPSIYHTETWRRDGVAHLVHFYDFGAYRIWGATGRMLNTLLNLLPPA